MKIWIDILTPKQLLFFEPIVEKLGKKHNLLCTSRKYDEVSKLAKIRNFDLIFVGRYGGSKKAKLDASIDRMGKLSKRISVFSPDMVISFCSPDAARVAYGLGIRHMGFTDSPHAEAAMRLTLPLIQRLFIPLTIPKDEFSEYGIDRKIITQYNAIDAFVTIQRKISQDKRLPFKNAGRKNILIRVEEEKAAYAAKSDKIIPIIKKIIKDYGDENIVILGRYASQIEKLRKKVGGGAKVIRMSFDGKYLLKNTDVFIGSGGTMTAESALMGIPTVSYNAVPNLVEDFLVKKHLVKRTNNPDGVSNYIKGIFESDGDENKKRAEKIRNRMQDPIEELITSIKEWDQSRIEIKSSLREQECSI